MDNYAVQKFVVDHIRITGSFTHFSDPGVSLRLDQKGKRAIIIYKGALESAKKSLYNPFAQG
jgi:hypothetical protein